MTIDLVASTDQHAEALKELVQAFVNEVGYYFGRTRDDDGVSHLPGVTDVPVVNPHRLVIESEGQTIGFLDWADVGEEGGNTLVAVYVSMGQRRRRAATQAIRALFEQHPGNWSLTMTPRFGPGLEFVSAVLRRFARPGSVTKLAFQREGQTYKRVIFTTGLDGMLVDPGGTPSDFTFDRSHHKERRKVLIWAMLVPILGGVLTLMLAWMGAQEIAIAFQWVVWITTVILWLVYLETVVTSILDRQDRGPIVRPVWMEREERK